ncbi:GRIP1-associated protein 1 [Nibea albiflora]|uniref:GRIP1-associated protein 1 n=1 Tax=Nibea albiflora TaxID=240163 RepID=A0ACB7EQC5_NIBAL|nr:GRIP1-associated protein 1 [Nibea albiflora]
MALNTEQEEKRLLRETVHNLEASKQAEISKLQEEITKGEKEALYNDSRSQLHSVLLLLLLLLLLYRYYSTDCVTRSVFVCRTKIDEINQRKEEELKTMNLRIHKLQSDLMAANQVSAELREQLQSKEKEHELTVHTLKDQIQTVKTQEMNLLREQQEALTAELQQRRAEQESLLAQRDDLDSQLQVLGVRARYEKELRGLHEDKNRSEEEIRQQLREEKVRRRGRREEVRKEVRKEEREEERKEERESGGRREVRKERGRRRRGTRRGRRRGRR